MAFSPSRNNPLPQHEQEEIVVLRPEMPQNDVNSISTFHSAMDGMRPHAFEEEFTVIEEEHPELRARFLTRESFSRRSDDDDIDIDAVLDDNELPPIPEFHVPPVRSYFEDQNAEPESAMCAGIEFIHEATSRAQKIISRVWKATWIQTPFHHLPDWLKDNDFLRAGHRPQIQSFRECFRSIFRIHTETGNIWTHMLGFVAFIGVAIYVMMSRDFPTEEKWVFGAFFAGAVICMGFSFMFHTLYCHSKTVGLLFLKLDYCGIAFLILGSFIPWMHFGFYCRPALKIGYLSVVSILAVAAVVVSLWNKFSQPAFRPVRATVFLSLGLSGLVPAIHSIISLGWIKSMQEASIHWLFFMGFLYVFGALMYAFRLPERCFPGRFDIWNLLLSEILMEDNSSLPNGKTVTSLPAETEIISDSADPDMKSRRSCCGMEDGLRERIPYRDRGSSDETGEDDCGRNFESLSDPLEYRDPSLFEEIRSDGEAALQAGMQILSETTDKAQQIIKKVLDNVWKPLHFHHLPEWLRDNDFLHFGHRPQMSMAECFRSIFRIHTETGNIWTHMLGFFMFIAIACYFFIFENFPTLDKWAVSAFFAGAVLCMAFSTLFHTVYCHSQHVGRLFGKLDYCGIALLTLGSFVPWLHFGFYCRVYAKLIYILVISVLASVAIVVSLWDRFSSPEYRSIRAGVFVALGLSGVIPTVHYIASEGWAKSVNEGSVIYLIVMGVLYVSGALLYAARIPERWFPGRFDIWFQSHQIFHVLVVAAAFIHYHGISLMATHRSTLGLTCPQM